MLFLLGKMYPCERAQNRCFKSNIGSIKDHIMYHEINTVDNDVSHYQWFHCCVSEMENHDPNSDDLYMELAFLEYLTVAFKGKTQHLY